MTNCITRVQADNPIATAKELKDVCKKRVNSYSSPQSPQHELRQSLSVRRLLRGAGPVI